MSESLDQRLNEHLNDIITKGLAPMIKNLQKEKETLTKGIDLLAHEGAEFKARWEELEEENEKLKEERNRDAGKYLGLLEKNTGLNLEIEELKDNFTHGNIHEIAKKNETLEEQIRLLGEENEKFKSQIPDKKGKKLSQNDKEVLKSIMDDIPVVNGIPGRVAQFKLLKRLMK